MSKQLEALRRAKDLLGKFMRGPSGCPWCHCEPNVHSEDCKAHAVYHELVVALDQNVADDRPAVAPDRPAVAPDTPEVAPMGDDEFNAIINGPLAHPLVPFTISRLALALAAVVASSPAAAEALRSHARAREQDDERKGGH